MFAMETLASQRIESVRWNRSTGRPRFTAPQDLSTFSSTWTVALPVAPLNSTIARSSSQLPFWSLIVMVWVHFPPALKGTRFGDVYFPSFTKSVAAESAGSNCPSMVAAPDSQMVSDKGEVTLNGICVAWVTVSLAVVSGGSL